MDSPGEEIHQTMAQPSLIGISIKRLIERAAHMHCLGKRRVDPKTSIIVQLRKGMLVLRHLLRPSPLPQGCKGWVGGRQGHNPVQGLGHELLKVEVDGDEARKSTNPANG
jgi:hypothetical protein